MPPGSSPWCVYVSICFSRAHKACLSFVGDRSRAAPARLGSRPQPKRQAGRSQDRHRDQCSIFSPFPLAHSKQSGLEWGTAAPESLRVPGKVAAGELVGWGTAALPTEPWAPSTGHPLAQVTHRTGHPLAWVTHQHGSPITIPSHLLHPQMPACMKRSMPPALH